MATREIGPFSVESRLGAGGMGIVYLCSSPSGRAVAVKVIRPEFASDPLYRRRFERELRAASSLSSPYIANVIGSGEDRGTLWLASEYVAGPTLGQLCASTGRLGVDAIRVLAHGLIEALSFIHSAGLIHRDLKPSNIVCTVEGPRIIDFGIAQSSSDITTDGRGVFGTPGFASPEQLVGGALGPASDIFSWACCIVFAALNRSPFGEASSDVLYSRTLEKRENLQGVPEPWRALVASCLKPDPDARPTIDRVRAALGHIGEPNLTSWQRTIDRYDPEGLLNADGEPSETSNGASRRALIGLGLMGLLALMTSSSVGIRRDDGSESPRTIARIPQYSLVRSVPVDRRPSAIVADPSRNVFHVIGEGGAIYGISSLGIENPANPAALKLHPAYDGGIQITPDGNYLFCCTDVPYRLIRVPIRNSEPIQIGFQLSSYSTGLVLAPSGAIYIPLVTDNTVDVVASSDITSLVQSASVASPGAVAISPDGRLLAVASFRDHSVKLFEISTLNAITSAIPVGAEPTAAAFNRTSSRLYVANASSSSISVIDIASRDVQEIEAGPNPTAIVASPHDSRIFGCTDGNSQVGKLIVLDDSAPEPSVSEVFDLGTSPRGLALSADGTQICATNFDGRTVSIISI